MLEQRIKMALEHLAKRGENRNTFRTAFNYLVNNVSQGSFNQYMMYYFEMLEKQARSKPKRLEVRRADYL